MLNESNERHTLPVGTHYEPTQKYDIKSPNHNKKNYKNTKRGKWLYIPFPCFTGRWLWKNFLSFVLLILWFMHNLRFLFSPTLLNHTKETGFINTQQVFPVFNMVWWITVHSKSIMLNEECVIYLLCGQNCILHVYKTRSHDLENQL